MHKKIRIRSTEILARTGVKVEGAPYMTYDDAREWISQTDSKPFKLELQNLLESSKKSVNLGDLFNPIREYCNKILELCLNSAVETEMLPEKFSGMNYSENKKIKDLIVKGKEVNRLVDSDQLLWHVLLEGRNKTGTCDLSKILREISFQNKNWQAVQGNKEYFWALAEGKSLAFNNFG